MDTKPPTRTLPRVVMKEWPGKLVYAEMDGSIWDVDASGPEPDDEMMKEFVRNNISDKALSDFTRVVEETGILDQQRSQKEKSRDE